MKSTEFITEGMTFSPSIAKKYIDHSGVEGTLLTSEPWNIKQEEKCWYCDGTGEEKYNDNVYPCDRCGGKGVTLEVRSSAPELEVSNSNGYAIQEMLGLQPDYSGTIYHKDLPMIMRKLILLKNKGSKDHIVAPSTSKGPMRTGTSQQGITQISPGPTMHDLGRSQSQVDRYIEKMIELVQFAQKNNAHISWG